jgi:hypothetical protein
LNQQFTVSAGVHYRNSNQYSRKLNATAPKIKPKQDDDNDGPLSFLPSAGPSKPGLNRDLAMSDEGSR